MKRVSFCFDDGFEATTEKARRLFDARGAAACFCVLAAPEEASDPAIAGACIAGWDVWRDMRASGHEVAPHGWAHELYRALPPGEAERTVAACWDRFEAELPGFNRSGSVFHIPYLTAPAAVLDWIGARALGVRAMADGGGVNDPAAIGRGGVVDCACYGPDCVGQALTDRLDRFIAGEEGWLVLVLHGLDGEGWGPVTSDEAARLLDAALDAGVEVVTPNRALLGSLPRA